MHTADFKGAASAESDAESEPADASALEPVPAPIAALVVADQQSQARAWRTAWMMSQCGVAAAVFTDSARAQEWQAHQRELWQAEAQWRAQSCR